MLSALTKDAVTISGRTFEYERPWDGRRLALARACPYLGFDTETEVVDLITSVPRLALASASTGRQHCLMHPDQVATFIREHRDARFVCHNASFDFWVVDRHLRDRGEEVTRRIWWDICRGNRLHCSMLLDMLIRLAEGRPERVKGSDSERVPPRNLAEVAAEYTVFRITKDDPYRLRYSEIIDVDWAEVEQGFFTYAIKDPIVTLRAYVTMTDVAERIMREHGYDPKQSPKDRHLIRPDAIKRFGFLSEQVQVKGSVALVQVTRNGMHRDLDRVSHLHAKYRRRLDEIHTLVLRDYPGVIRLDRQGQVKLTTKGRLPSLDETRLRERLVQAAGQVEAEKRVAIPIPKTPTGKVSTSAKAWAAYKDRHPLFEVWSEREKASKMCEFFGDLEQAIVHPAYNVLTRTGRTSCQAPNLQQVPRQGGFRELYVAEPGYFLLASDYSFVELCTLAAVCEAKFGYARMADTIRDGVDPHRFTAAMLLGIPIAKFLAMAEVEDEVEDEGVMKRIRGYWHKKHRQNAKPVNFGVPGGLTAEGLVGYARTMYKVDMTLEQARENRTRLISEVYPELNEVDGYLADDTFAILARNLKAREEDCWEAFDRAGNKERFVARGVENLVKGRTSKADGTPYNKWWVSEVWESLNDLNRNGDPRLVELLETRQAGEELHELLFRRDVVTLTGRVRGKVDLNQSRNTPFQSLAADGALLALFESLYQGFEPVGFIHDEILYRVPDRGGFVDLETVEQIRDTMCRAMESVTVTVPVQCEPTLSTCWSKNATLIVRDRKVFPWSPDEKPG